MSDSTHLFDRKVLHLYNTVWLILHFTTIRIPLLFQTNFEKVPQDKHFEEDSYPINSLPHLAAEK